MDRANLICSPAVSACSAAPHACSTSRVSARVGQHHHGEEVTAQKCRVIDGPDVAARIRGCLNGPPEVPQAVTKLG